MSRYGSCPNRATFDADVAHYHAAGHDDCSIAFILGVWPKTVARSRERQELAALYGPGGRRILTAAAA